MSQFVLQYSKNHIFPITLFGSVFWDRNNSSYALDLTNHIHFLFSYLFFYLFIYFKLYMIVSEYHMLHLRFSAYK